jgi:hypothetical protein
MIRYSNFRLLLALLASSTLALTGCYEEPDWLGDNTVSLGNFPVISSFSVVDNREFELGETVELDLRFWSDAPIQEIVLSSLIGDTKTEAATFGYTPNFAEDSQTDKLLMSYTIPNELPEDVSSISLEVNIINENGLNRTRTVTVNVNVPPVCAGVETIAGTYLATTSATTPFDGAYDNTGSPYEVTITETDDGFLVSDITGGLYGEFYAAAYANLGVQDLPALLMRNECEVSATDVPEDPGFEAEFGANLLNATGNIAADGTITIEYTNEAGDVGTTVLAPQ